MDLTKFKRMIGQCNDIDDLHKLKMAATERIEVLAKRNAANRLAEAWDKVKDATKGARLYAHCHTTVSLNQHTFSGSAYHPGSNNLVGVWGREFVVLWLRPRKKVMFVSIGSKIYKLGPEEIAHIDLRMETCAEALGDVLTGDGA